MKGLKTSVISIFAVGLLVGSAVGVAAQEEAAYFTGKVTPGSDNVDATFEEEDGVQLARDEMRLGDTIETTDSRMSGMLSTESNADIHIVSDTGFVMPLTTAWRIENDGGAWSGQGTGLSHFLDGDQVTIQTVVLTGEDGYDGMTAVIAYQPQGAGPDAVTGVVFPREMPPFPEAPPAE